MLKNVTKVENLNDYYAACNNHGKCNNAPDPGAGTCTCLPPYAGSNCSIDCGKHGQGELFYWCCMIQLLLLTLFFFNFQKAIQKQISQHAAVMHTGQDPIVAHFVILEIMIRIIPRVYVSQLVVTLEQLAHNLCGYMWL